MRRAYSIKRRLIASVLLVELLSAVCVTGLAFFYERHAHMRAFEVMLRGRAYALLGAVQDAEDAADNVMLDGTEKGLPEKDIYQVWDEKGRMLGRSANWDGREPGWLAGGRAADERQPARLRVDGEGYRVIRVEGVRIVDPGDKNGGVRRAVTIFYGSPTRAVWRAVWGAVEFYAETSLGLLVVTGLMMYWLLGRGLAPLGELARQAAGVSAQSWEFVPSDAVRGTMELAPLAGALEMVLAGLERSFEQQRRFVGDAAHELKTGVAVVKSSLQLLAMKQRTAAEYAAGLERCQLDCERMEEIVAKMLLLARIEAAVEDEGKSADLDAVVRQVGEALESMAAMARVRIEIVSSGGMEVGVGAEQLEVLCSNLMVNAVQHSGEGATVRVVVERVLDAVELRVVDEGEGIEAEVLPYVFDRFYRSDPSRSRRTGGTGLGLAIVKAIVERAGGSVAIESEVGRGTTVVVRLKALRAVEGFV